VASDRETQHVTQVTQGEQGKIALQIGPERDVPETFESAQLRERRIVVQDDAIDLVEGREPAQVLQQRITLIVKLVAVGLALTRL
jgi:hypothetical protein